MLSQHDNEALTIVEPGAPMHALLRRYWTPVMRAARVEAGGAPVKARLLGQDYVVYRSPAGQLAMVDERCAHRCASLSLARNEPDGLRCIFHGWKFAPSGELLEAPTEAPVNQEVLKGRVRLNTYPVREAGGLIWAFLDAEAEPPPFPAFEFTALPDTQVDIRIAVLPVNWLQVMESVLDSAHLGFLHRSSMELAVTANTANTAGSGADTAPVLEFDRTPYGFREAAIRSKPNGQKDVRIRAVVAPYYVFLPGRPGAERQLVTTVPIDNLNCFQLIVTYNPSRPFRPGEIDALWFHTHPNRDDFSDPAPGPLGWPQDREAMGAGHFSGIVDRHVFYEDFAVLQSMGRIADRRFEHLSNTDATIVLMRRELLKALRAAGEGGPGWGLDTAVDHAAIRTAIFELPPGAEWRSSNPETEPSAQRVDA